MPKQLLKDIMAPERPKRHHSYYTTNRNLSVKVLDFIKSGGPSGIRTLDTRIKSPVL